MSASNPRLNASSRRLSGVFLPSLALLIAGFALRWMQVPIHSNVWAIDWLSYYEPQARDLRAFRPLHFLFSWQGLHPPVSGWIHGLGIALGLSLAAHWTLTCAAGLGAGLLLGKTTAEVAGWPALVFTLAWIGGSSFQANYGPNTTPYPWSLLAVAISTSLLWRAQTQPGRKQLLAAGLAAAIAAQVHILAAACVIAQLCMAFWYWRESESAERPSPTPYIAPVGLSLAVLVAVSLGRTRDPWTFHIGETEGGWAGQLLQVLGNRFPQSPANQWLFGLLLVGFLLALALPKERNPAIRRFAVLLLTQGLAALLALGLFLELNVADPRLTHYLLIPHLLLISGAALGWARGLSLVPEGLRTTLTLCLALSTGLSAGDALQWSEKRSATIESEGSTAATAALRAAMTEAGTGDSIAYLWDHQFLNDEPEQWDPAAAGWPMGRLGRACLHLDFPPALCNHGGGASYFFAPDAFTGDLGSLEESLRRFVNEAQAPGQAQFLIQPGPEAPPRPWPMEEYCLKAGGQFTSLEGGKALIVRFPPGTRIAPPPPLHPEG